MDNLSNMKYTDLQRLAKKFGIKANMKADKLIKAIQEHRAITEDPSEDSGPDIGERKIPPKSTPTPAAPSGRTPKHTPRVGTPVEKKTPLSGVKRFSQPRTPDSSAKKSQVTPKRKASNGSSPLPDKTQGLPPARRSSGRKRSHTYTLVEGTVPSPSVTSPTVKEMMDSMKEGMSNDEMKESLQNVLDKNAQVAEAKRHETAIPRFAAFAMKRKAEAQKKPITPGNKDWAKIHQREFEKMDSLDVYLQKKRQRTESITASVKKARQVAEQAKAAVSNLRSCMSPVNRTKASLFKSAVSQVSFVPKVTSTADITTNFSAVKSPVVRTSKQSSGSEKESSRKSPRLASGDAQNRKSISARPVKAQDSRRSVATRKSLGNTENKNSVSASENKNETPFKLGMSFNQTLPVSQTKDKFDLKASLARPLTWKPYTGKLKPLEKENLYAQKAGAYRVDPKAVKVQTKAQKRMAMKSHQANKRYQLQMKRRGVE